MYDETRVKIMDRCGCERHSQATALLNSKCDLTLSLCNAQKLIIITGGNFIHSRQNDEIIDRMYQNTNGKMSD